ncbi:TPA: hypothetical protein KOC32_004280 [Clostridioides difficile]|nr:hypothetical protein [Clostridioides difficile]
MGCNLWGGTKAEGYIFRRRMRILFYFIRRIDVDIFLPGSWQSIFKAPRIKNVHYNVHMRK